MMKIFRNKFYSFFIYLITLISLGAGFFVLYPSTVQEIEFSTPQGWTLFHPEEKFKICFPTLPDRIQKELALSSSRTPIHYVEYRSVSDQGMSFAVSYVHLPLKFRIYSAGTILKAAFDLLPENGPVVKVISKREFSYRKHPAFEFVVKEGNLETRGRLILVGGILYKLTVSSTVSLEASPEYTPFFDSFQWV